MAARIRICWPYPGQWCLAGRCPYCSAAGFVELSRVKTYAKSVTGLRRALKYSENRGFPNHGYRS